MSQELWWDASTALTGRGHGAQKPQPLTPSPPPPKVTALDASYPTGHMVECAEAAVYELTEGAEVVGLLVSSEAATQGGGESD